MALNERKRTASDTISITEAPDSKKQCLPAPSATTNAWVSESDAPTLAQDSVMPTDSSAQHDTITAAAPSVATTSTSGFFGPLPQELEDRIFEFAYQRDPAMKFMMGARWARQEEQKRKDSRTYVTLPFPNPYVSQWLVSKRYFVAAASVWFGSEPFHFTPKSDPFSVVMEPVTPYDFCRLGLFRDFVVVVKSIYSNFAGGASGHQRLTELSLTMDYDWESCSRGLGKYAWQELLVAADFNVILKRSSLLKIRGLNTLKLEFTPRHVLLSHAKTDEDKAMLQTNTRELEKVLRSTALQPRVITPAKSDDGPLPLYSGSRVFWTQPMEDEATTQARRVAKRLESLENAVDGKELILTKEMCKGIASEFSMLPAAAGTKGDALKENNFPMAALLKLAKWSRAIYASEKYVNPHESLRTQVLELISKLENGSLQWPTQHPNRKPPAVATSEPELSSDQDIDGPLAPQRTHLKPKRFKGDGQSQQEIADPRSSSSARFLLETVPESPQALSAVFDIVPGSDAENVLEPSDPSAPHPTRWFLLNIAVELQCMIFEMAYTHEEGSRYLRKSLWEVQEEDKAIKDDNYQPEEFFIYKINEWLLSKQYLVQAAQAWFKSNMGSLVGPLMTVSHWFTIGFYRPMIASLELRFQECTQTGGKAFLMSCVRLKRLSLTIERCWLVTDGNSMWRTTLDKRSTLKFLGISSLRQLRGLESITVTSAFCREARNDEARKVLGANMALIQETLQETVLLPKTPAYIKHHSGAEYLYPGSKVRWEGEAHRDLSEPGGSLTSSSRAATPEVTSQCDPTLRQAQASLMPLTHCTCVSTPRQTGDVSQSSDDLEEETLDEIEADLTVLLDVARKQRRKHGGSTIVKGFPSRKPHADWHLENRL
ncbi:hypothetical protein LTR95_003878 [Oleoguttula sp. CCFEE 5521]